MGGGTLHGELRDDGQIVLAAAGEPWEQSAIAVALDHITAPLKDSTPPGLQLVACSWPVAVQLSYIFDGKSDHGWWMPGPRLAAWIQVEAARRTAPLPTALPFALPEGLVPWEFQVTAAAMIARTGKLQLWDDAGTGKTVSVTLGLRWLQHKGTAIFPCVVVVPAWEIARAWQEIITNWAPGWRAVLWEGPKRQELTGTADVYLTTYATTRLDAPPGKTGPLVKLKPAAVIADECHAIRNHQSQQSKSVRRITQHASIFIGMSGTAIVKDFGDTWAPQAAMEPDAWPSRRAYTGRYCQKGREPEYGEAAIEGLNRGNEAEFWTVMTGTYRYLDKKTALPFLPPKVYSVRRLEIPPEWRKSYDSMAEDMLAQLPDGGELPVFSTLAQLTRLSQLASSAAEVEEIPEFDEDGQERIRYEVTLIAPSWKAEALLRICEERPGQPVVAYSVSKPLALIAGKLAEEAGLRTGYLIGVGGGVTKTTRQKAVNDLQAGKLDLLVATAGAGGVGITLTRSGTCVMMQRAWSLDLALQPEDRLQRPGAEKHHESVEIIDLVAKDTLEDRRIRPSLRAKGKQLGQLIRRPDFIRELLGGIK